MITDYSAYWPMDEGSGNIVDVSGNAYTGTNNGTTVITGKYNNGRNFVSASSQYITMGNILDFTTGDFTISFWYRTTSGTSGYLLAKRAAASGAYVVYFNTNGRIALYIQTNDTNWSQRTSDYSTSNGVWRHFAGVKSGTSLFIYTDGFPPISSTPQSAGTVTTITNTGDLTFSSLTQLYNGDLDEVKIYSRALSSLEVYELYTAQNTILTINRDRGIRPRPFAPGLAR